MSANIGSKEEMNYFLAIKKNKIMDKDFKEALDKEIQKCLDSAPRSNRAYWEGREVRAGN